MKDPLWWTSAPGLGKVVMVSGGIGSVVGLSEGIRHALQEDRRDWVHFTYGLFMLPMIGTMMGGMLGAGVALTFPVSVPLYLYHWSRKKD
jgi:hypothetical protein